MKRKIIPVLTVLLFLAGAGSAAADFRADLGVRVPVYLGISFDSASGTSSTGVDVLQNFLFLLPTGSFSYEFGEDTIRAGVGVRMYTLILESMLWPAAWVEMDLDPLVLRLEAGGGAYAFFGLYNAVQTGALVIPDLSAQIKISDTFRVGVGAFALVGEWTQTTGNYPFAVYLDASFVLR